MSACSAQAHATCEVKRNIDSHIHNTIYSRRFHNHSLPAVALHGLELALEIGLLLEHLGEVDGSGRLEPGHLLGIGGYLLALVIEELQLVATDTLFHPAELGCIP